MIPNRVKKQAILIPESQIIKLVFPYNLKDLDFVRALHGRRYEPKLRYWTIPVSVEAVLKLKEHDWPFDPELTAFHNNYLMEQAKPPVVIESIPGLQKELFPYQHKGVEMIERHNGRALLGDDMGLGKTAQSLAWLQLHRDKVPVVIVVPASLKLNWRKEIRMWMDRPKVVILSGREPNLNLMNSNAEIYIINYDIIESWKKVLMELHPQVLIADECHYFRNNQAKRTKAIKKLAKTIPHIICISGTPIVNRPIEIFNAINMINPHIFPNWLSFGRKYCDGKHDGFGWNFNGSSNTEELNTVLTNHIMIRRLKQDVLKDLPDKIRSFVPVAIDNQNEYDSAERDFISYMRSTQGAERAEKASNAAVLAEIEGLKQLAVKGKMADIKQWIHNFLESDEKLVLFAVHRFVIDMIMEEFRDITVKIDGSVSTTSRQGIVERFQNDPKIRLFVGNIKAAGVGITLTAASNVAFIELPWTPGDLTQAEDRCHRIGQKNAVNIHYLIAEDTIEDRIARLIDQKRKVLDAVLDNVETETESLLTSLKDEYTK